MNQITPTEPYANRDEIDLIEMVKVLWNKKGWIALISCVTTLLAGVYAFTAKEQWTSKAEVSQAQFNDFSEYLYLKQEYARLTKSENVEAAALSNEMFAHFQRISQSLDKREDFFENSALFKKLAEGKDEAEKRRILSKLVQEHLEYAKPDAKKYPDSPNRIITFSAETPADAQDTLHNFMQYANQAAYNIEINNFTVLLNAKIRALKYEFQQLEEILKIENSVLLENLRKANNIAEQAGVKEYTNTIDNLNVLTLQNSDYKLGDNSYLFMLGEKYLKAQIDVNSKVGVVYPPRYYELKEILPQLETLLNNVNQIKANTFSYLASPDYPVKRDKPNRLLVLLIGMILGAIVSSVVIIFSEVFRRN